MVRSRPETPNATQTFNLHAYAYRNGVTGALAIAIPTTSVGSVESTAEDRCPQIEQAFQDPAPVQNLQVHDHIIEYGPDRFMVFWANRQGARPNWGRAVFGDVFFMRTDTNNPRNVIDLREGDKDTCDLLIEKIKGRISQHQRGLGITARNWIVKL